MREISIKNIVTYLVIILPSITSQLVKCIQLYDNYEDYLNKGSKPMKKKAIKTIKSKYGDSYDCVDFYEQLAFDHPLLKNHTFHPQMKPSFTPRRTKMMSNQENERIIEGGTLDDGGCPIGSVPIKRICKDDFIQMKRFTEEYASRPNLNANALQPRTYLAVLQTNSDQSRVKYYGAGGLFNVYNPSVAPYQYSSAVLIVQNGNDQIQVGWTVNPKINQDNRTHLFQYFKAGQSHCFNMLCPGFVSVSRYTPIDKVLEGIAKRGQRYQYSSSINVEQDPKDGNWWLEFEGVMVGFWPQKIFTSLATSASYIAAGGEAYSPPHEPLPPMGNGYYPVEIPWLSAYCAKFHLLDANHTEVDDPQDTETYTSDSHYGVYDGGQVKAMGRTIYYGGTTLQ